MSGNHWGAAANYGDSSKQVDGKVGIEVRYRRGTSAQFMREHVTRLNHQQYNYQPTAIKSLLENKGHIAFRGATLDDASPYLALLGLMNERNLLTLRPKGKTDRVTIGFYCPYVTSQAPKDFVRAPTQVGVDALASLKASLVNVRNQHSTTSIPKSHMLGYLPSSRPHCIMTHDDHGCEDFDAQGFFDKFTVRFNYYVGMGSALVIEVIGYRINELGEVKRKKFGECSWDLGSSGFYAFCPVGSGRHGRYSIVDPESGYEYLICFQHGVVKRQSSTPNLTARSVFCVDLTFDTQAAATELVRSLVTSPTLPVSIAFGNNVDLSHFGTTLASSIIEATRIIRTLVPFEEEDRNGCRSCRVGGTLIDTRTISHPTLIGSRMCNVGSAVCEVNEDGSDGLVGVISNINHESSDEYPLGSVNVTYVLTSGDRVCYIHDPSTLRPATDAERDAVLGERTDQPNVDDANVFQTIVCHQCAEADGGTQAVNACKTCHREPTLGDLAQCSSPDCGDYHCSGLLHNDTRHFLCSNTGTGIRLTSITQYSEKKKSICAACGTERARLWEADAKGRSTVMRTVAWGMALIAELISRSALGQHGLFLNGESTNLTTIRAHIKGGAERIASICSSLEADFIASNGQDQINTDETMKKAFGGQGPGSPATIEYKCIDQP